MNQTDRNNTDKGPEIDTKKIINKEKQLIIREKKGRNEKKNKRLV